MDETKTTEEIVTAIIDWEIKNGESFADFFMFDNVDNGAWAYWLLAKGHVKHANKIIMAIFSGENDIDLEILYHVYDENVDDISLFEKNMVKNIELMGEFIAETPKYLIELNKFLKKQI